jgi:hypothetical protein
VSQELLSDCVRVLGPDHLVTLATLATLVTLATRGSLAHWTGRCGDAPRELQLFEELLPDQIRVLGPDHPETLTTRHNIAHWTGRRGDAPRALRAMPGAAARPCSGPGPGPPRHPDHPPQHGVLGG